MLLTMAEICEYAGNNPSQRRFIEGERILRAGHLLNCGKMSETTEAVILKAFCLQTSHIKDKPHEIDMTLADSKVEKCMCSCKAGLGGKCKHIVAALLYCWRKGDDLPELSCTDIECAWKKQHKDILEKYGPLPLSNHSCFMNKNSDDFVVNISSDEIKEIALQNLPGCAFSKDQSGRHEPKHALNKSKVSDAERMAIKLIYLHQDVNNIILQSLQKLQVGSLNECCNNILSQLGSVNFEQLTEDTRNWYNVWRRERQYRVTGSICYSLFTYSKNKNADWESKCNSTFYPKNFSSDYTEYGKNKESEARQVFVQKYNIQVIEVGLIVSKQNPWLAYSPDGVIFDKFKPVALLEIKCPFIGKTSNIHDTVKSLIDGKQCLVKNGDVISLKKKHKYYGQVQLGMAMLNVKTTYFVIYSSFDKSVFTMKIDIDITFLTEMLSTLKRTFYTKMLHRICVDNCSENVDENVDINNQPKESKRLKLTK